jgi:ferredoxin hydrogenase large subunit
MSTTEATPRRLVIDPVTRIEGHLKIEAELDRDRVVKACSGVQLFRGIEMILKGRKPQDAPHFTQRTCGVCTTTHALTSVRAVEDAADVTPPPNAVLVRHLIHATLMLHDHLVHFYHLHGLDWFDPVNALEGDPVAAARTASEASGREKDPGDFFLARNSLESFARKGRLGFLDSGHYLGGHPAYRLSPEENLVLAANYLTALKLQVDLSRATAVFASKQPHGQTVLPGGVTCYESLTPERMDEFAANYARVRDFMIHDYPGDVAILARAHPEAWGYGATVNFFDFDEFAEAESGRDPLFKAGVVWGDKPRKPERLDPLAIEEHVSRSWYQGEEPRRPWGGETVPAYTSYDDDQRYSWSKAPRYRGEPLETGPLARCVLGLGRGDSLGKAMAGFLARMDREQGEVNSTMGRTAARAVETAFLAGRVEGWLDELRARVAGGDRVIYREWKMPDTARGVGFAAVPRGGLSHWIRIEKGRIANYQMVVPSTWNLGPRCAEDKPGPVERSLAGTRLADPERPVEILRTVHSFDPCIACAVHLIVPGSATPAKIRIR